MDLFGNADEIGNTYLIEFETSNDKSGRGICRGLDTDEAEENFERWWYQAKQNDTFGGLEWTLAIAIIRGPGIAWISED